MPDEVAAAPEFSRFVSSVKGRLVSRWDAPNSSFGARVATAEERAAGGESIVWDEECVVPLLASFCDRFDRELRNALRNGDLKERKREDYDAWLKRAEERETAHQKSLDDAKAEKGAAPTPAETPPPEEAGKPTTRKKTAG